MREQVENGMRESLYDILEVSRTASPEVIRAAYKSLVQRFHPDKNPGNPNAEDLLKLINNAYDTLSDPSKRAAYDVMLALEEMASPEKPAEEENAEESGTPSEQEADHAFVEKWDLYQAFIGKNPNYYRPIFKRVHITGKTSHAVNWPALLAGGGWAAYRKLYGIAALHFVLLAAGLGLMQFFESPFEWLALIPFVGMSVWLSMSANALYFRHASKTITEISSRDIDSAEIFRTVHLAGGVNALAPLIFAGLSAIAVLASNELVPSSQPEKVELATAIPAPRPRAESAPAPAPTPVAPTPLPRAPEQEPTTVRAPKARPETAPVPVPVKPVEKRKPKPDVIRKMAPPPPTVIAIARPRRPATEAPEYPDLATAVSSGDRTAVEKMLKDGEDINLIKNNQVPLIIAVKNGDIAMVRLLIAHGADVNLTDARGNTAMIYAKVGADAKLIEILKNAGAKNPFD